jgi:hypothetical protein
MNIGQTVRIKKFTELPADLQTQKFIGLAGFEATIVDRLYSEARLGYVYTLRLTGAKTIPTTLFPEETLDLVEEEEEPAEYIHEIEYLENVVLVIFYKVQNGEKTEIARGHGHVIHEGMRGIAQAASFAMKRCYAEIEGPSGR